MIDFDVITEEHKEEIIRLIRKYKKEDSKPWLDIHFPIYKDAEIKDTRYSYECRNAITDYTNELIKRLKNDIYNESADKVADLLKDMGVKL